MLLRIPSRLCTRILFGTISASRHCSNGPATLGESNVSSVNVSGAHPRINSGIRNDMYTSSLYQKFVSESSVNSVSYFIANWKEPRVQCSYSSGFPPSMACNLRCRLLCLALDEYLRHNLLGLICPLPVTKKIAVTQPPMTSNDSSELPQRSLVRLIYRAPSPQARLYWKDQDVNGRKGFFNPNIAPSR